MYTYAHMKDQTKEGVKAEASAGLAIAAVWFQTTLGIPREIFDEWLQKLPTAADSVNFYMKFRTQHPELFV